MNVRPICATAVGRLQLSTSTNTSVQLQRLTQEVSSASNDILVLGCGADSTSRRETR